MKKILLNVELAKEAKELGFDKSVGSCYSTEGRLYLDTRIKNGDMPTLIAAPTHSEISRWLWDKHGIFIEITLWGDGIGFQGMVKHKRGVEDDGSAIVYQLFIVEALYVKDDYDALVEKTIKKTFKYIKENKDEF